MTTFLDGLEVPANYVEFFTKASDASGYVTFDLSYTPTGLHACIIDVHSATVGAYPYTLVGKQLKAVLFRLGYDKPDTPIGNENSGGAGADPHTHALAFTSTITDAVVYASSGNFNFAVSYQIEKGG